MSSNNSRILSYLFDPSVHFVILLLILLSVSEMTLSEMTLSVK